MWKEAFRHQNPIGRPDYRAEVNGDIWKIDITNYFCQNCGDIQNPVDNEDDLCYNCRK